MVSAKNVAALAVIVLFAAVAAIWPQASRAADVFVADGVLHINGGDEPNELVVTPSAGVFVVDDPAAPLVAGTGCMTTTPTRATCTAFVTEIDAEMGAGDDIAGFWGVLAPVSASGEGGDDVLEGGAARDVLVGGDGNDGINGRGDADRLSGAAGDDVLEGSRGRDTLEAAGGDDVLEAGRSRDDVLLGEDGRDLLRAGRRGAAFLSGGDGDDLLVAHGGRNVLIPGPGEDTALSVDRTSDELHCSAADSARATGGGAVRGCDTVSVPAPEAWPPPPGSEAAAALIPPPPAGLRVRPLIRGNATRVEIWVDDTQIRTVTLCIRAWDSGEGVLNKFTKKHVQTKVPKIYEDSRLRLKTYYAIGHKHACQ